jgi:acyl-CoA hydrolase
MRDDIERVLTISLATNPALRREFMLIDQPVAGNIRFGKLLEVLDKLAEDVALGYVRRHFPDGRVVTAAVDQIQVRGPADIDRDLRFRARINFVGRRSVEVGIRCEHPESGGRPVVHIASCYFTMVARSADETRSLFLPGFEPRDEVAAHRWEKAAARREAYRAALTAAEEPPGRDEYFLLQRLHSAQEDPGFDGLLARDLVTTGWERMYPEQENVPKKIFGGYVIRKAYEQSAICAELVAPHRPVIVSVNRINFNQPVRMGDRLRFESRVTYAGERSISVETDILRLGLDRSQAALSNTCVFSFVNVDETLTPQAVPAVYPTTYREDARFLAAYRRRQLHLRLRAQARAAAGRPVPPSGSSPGA